MASRAPAAAPVVRAVEPGSAHRVQRETFKLSRPNDASEREAEQIARRVVTMPSPAAVPRERISLLAARAPAPVPNAPPRSDEVSPELTSEIRSQLGSGGVLPADTRSFMEPRFKASFAGVRIHTDARAASLATRLGARAFTYGRDIFFNTGQFQAESPEGMELIAHELTHTIQQREVVQREVEVTQHTGPRVQRGIVSEALDWIADKANNIPGYRLFTIVIGRNPINMEKVERSGANILRALIEFIPGGHMIVEALENHGVIQKGGKFIEDRFAELGDLGAALRDALMEFIDSLGWRDIFRLGSLWSRAKRIFSVPVDKAIAFGKNLVGGIAQLVKDAILKPLGAWASRNIPKWDLLVGVFGKNPISDEGESPASALIGGFMNLIGQGEIWENIKKGNAVAKAWQWFQTAMKGALSLVLSIPGRVMSTIRSLTIFDIVTLVGAFKKIVGAFASFVGDFIKWAGGTVLQLLEIILTVVAPSVVPYLKKAGAAFSTIIKAPGTFIGNLVKAGRQGFDQFKANIVKHLRDGLFKWLLGSAEGAGIYFPKSFAPLELLKMGLSVLGLTWVNIRGKLVAATNETVVKALETGFDLVRTLVKEGPAAAWKQLLESLTNLKTMIVDAAIDMVKSEVVRIAIEKLVSFLTPAGAFIQAIIAIYRTVMFVVNKLAEIGRLVAAFIDGIAAIARGAIAPAANRVETVLATGLSLAISFLANFAGLGNVPKKVMQLIKKIRDPVDKALDKVVAWIIDGAKKLGKMLFGSDKKPVPPAKSDKPSDGELGKTVSFSAPDGGHKLWIDTKGGGAELMMASTVKPLSAHLGDFKTDAKQLDQPAKGKVLGAIGTALPLARTIEKKAKEAAKKAIGAPDRDSLDKAIEGHEEALRPTLVTILDELGVRVPDKTDLVTCIFLRSPNIQPPAFGEYTSQLKRQEAQINAMTLHIWIERRKQFEQFSAQSDRKSLDDRARKQACVALEDAMTERLTYPENAPAGIPAVARIAAMPGASAIVSSIFQNFAPSTRSKGLAASTARAQVQAKMKGMAVLHEPDKVAGGRYDQISDIGLGSVNSDIGANWGGVKLNVSARQPIANNVEKTLRAEMKRKKVSQAFWRKVKMNLILTHK